MKSGKGFGGARSRVPPAKGDEEAAPARAAPQRRTRRAAQTSRARDGREQQLRANQDVHPGSDTPWAAPTSLEAPPARPGFKQKWVRCAIFGKPDVQNMARKFREGWLPRQANSVPKSFHAPTIRSGQFVGSIGVEGSILCEMPSAKVAQRNAHYRAKSERMAQDIERNVANVNSRIPHHAGFGRIRKTSTTKVLTHRNEDAVDSGEEIEA